ncbi:ABC transporter permease [Occallatibacter riparius]|uniref:ABC transporter permease n=1 Tax=Occallatibacter riparius TaxID=1002689 RepID=A0A9J7BMB0_9BACT|nr:ABC transporter permease [Occallatibacter riparius]UWZ83633.1 ABC transporter permease [Occallatibacter riparius]
MRVFDNSLWDAMRARWSALRHRSAMRRELGEELHAHIQHRADDLERGGMSRVEAERQARVEFGGFEHYREESHSAQGWHWAEALLRDVRFGLRVLMKSPSFTAAAVITLALGIGANTALFTLVRGILLRPLPVRAGHRLVVVWDSNPGVGLSRVGPSGQDYLDWKEQGLHSFEDLFLFEHGTGTVTGNGDPEQLAGLRVTTNFGDFFGIVPVVGRTFLPEEKSARHTLAVLSYRYWKRKYQGNAAVCGQSMTLNGENYTIIGVLPASFDEMFPVDVVVPFDDGWVRRADSDLGVLGRLRPGVTVSQASAEMNQTMARVVRQRPERKGFGTVMVLLESVRMEYIRPALLVLQCAVAFILILACANVANLMLSRGTSRRQEIAVRISLGATRKQIVRQFLVESSLLAMLGGMLGLGLAWVSMHLWARYGPAQIPVPNAAYEVTLPAVHLGGSEVVFALVVSLATGILFGLIAPLRLFTGNTQDALKNGGRGTIGAVRGRGTRAVLVVVEGALALVLVVGASLMIKSFSRLLAVNPGFDANRLLTLRIKLSADAAGSAYRDPAKRAAAFHDFLEQVRGVPGVESAAFTEIVPLSQDDMDRGPFVIEEKPMGDVKPSADYRDISPGYFETMRIPLLQGRSLTEEDDAQHPRVVVIDQTLAREYFGTENPIGKHVVLPYGSRVPRMVVGVVGAVHDSSLSGASEATIYFPYMQGPNQTMSMVVRTAQPEDVVLPGIRNAILSVDRNQPVFEERPMAEIMGNVTSAPRMAFILLDVLALVALVLAAVGIYGVTSYHVGQRTQEVGVRLTFGATPEGILRMLVRQATTLTLAGVGAGLVCALLMTRLMSSLLYGVSSTDPVIFVGGAALVTLVATIACYLPARRAVRVEPLAALRSE